MIWVMAALLPSCAVMAPEKPHKDPLSGQIVNTRTGEAFELNSLVESIRDYDVIYLSEKHDNPEHHAVQQKIISQLIKIGKRPSLGFEFFSMDSTPDILNFIDSGNHGHSEKLNRTIEKDLRKKLGWENQPDTLWQFYLDLLNTAKQDSLFAAGLDLSSTLIKRITRKGLDGITDIEKEMIFSTGRPDDVYRQYMYGIFKNVHCGMESPRMQARLYDTWTARNDRMALSVSKLVQQGQTPLVVIIGGGHTEFGLGVINRVEKIDKKIRQVNVSLQEVSIRTAELSRYLEPLELKGFKPVPPADFIWFTNRVSDEDPCLKFKESLKKMSGKKVTGHEPAVQL